MRKKIIVIGSGFGGLGIAIRLAAKGHNVEIYEKLDKPGGRAYVYEINGFTFDAGPTVITAPFLFNELFDLASRKIILHLNPWTLFTVYLIVKANTLIIMQIPISHLARLISSAQMINKAT